MPDSAEFPILPLPRGLRKAADELLAVERSAQARQSLTKRFAVGAAENDLAGFFVDGLPFVAKDIPEGFVRRPSPVPEPTGSEGSDPGRLAAFVREGDESWLKFAKRVQFEAANTLRMDLFYSGLLTAYGEIEWLPKWIRQFSRGREHEIIQIHHARPYFKSAKGLHEQCRFLRQIAIQNHALAGFYAPMIGFELDDQTCVCVMPWMEEFVTLHDVLCMASKVEHKPAKSVPWLKDISLEKAFQLILRNLAEILRLDKGQSSLERSPRELFVAKFKERLDDTIPILLGIQAHQQSTEWMHRNIEFLASAALYNTKNSELRFGHGDLNATNIMLAPHRRRSGEIDDICVRLIDPNPSGRIGDRTLELSRLLHWVELGLPLRCRRSQERTAFEIHFQRSAAGQCLLDRPGRLVLDSTIRPALNTTYQAFFTAFQRAFPDLTDDLEQQKLSLGIGLFHLVASRYWERSADRTAAYLAGYHEISSIRSVRDTADPRTLEYDGMEKVRRSIWDTHRKSRKSVKSSSSTSADLPATPNEARGSAVMPDLTDRPNPGTGRSPRNRTVR